MRRVLDTTLSMRDKSLVLLHASDGVVSERDLISSVEHKNASVYRRDILRKAHKERLVEFDAEQRTVAISPLGIELVETEILPRIAS